MFHEVALERSSGTLIGSAGFVFKSIESYGQGPRDEAASVPPIRLISIKDIDVSCNGMAVPDHPKMMQNVMEYYAGCFKITEIKMIRTA